MSCNKQNFSKNILPEIVDVEKNLNEDLKKHFRGQKDGFVQVGPNKWFLPFKYKKLAQEYLDFEVRSDDVWIIGIPRSGTNLTQDLARCLCHSLDPDGKSPNWFESNIVLNEKAFKERFGDKPDHPDLPHFQNFEKMLQRLNEEKKRRIIKSHLPLELLPPDIFKKSCKVIYICRYPKDTSLSYYTLQSKTWHIDYNGDFESYWNFYKNGNVLFGPYFDHVKQGYEKRNDPNFLFIFYEDLTKDLKGYIKKIATFLERPLTDEELTQFVTYFEFDNFKKNFAKGVQAKDSGKVEIVSQGIVGRWKNHFTEKMNKEADEWIEKNSREIGINFPEVN